MSCISDVLSGTKQNTSKNYGTSFGSSSLLASSNHPFATYSTTSAPIAVTIAPTTTFSSARLKDDIPFHAPSEPNRLVNSIALGPQIADVAVDSKTFADANLSSTSGLHSPQPKRISHAREKYKRQRVELSSTSGAYRNSPISDGDSVGSGIHHSHDSVDTEDFLSKTSLSNQFSNSPPNLLLSLPATSYLPSPSPTHMDPEHSSVIQTIAKLTNGQMEGAAREDLDRGELLV
ncbi:unnamed protein product [Protopolystoma xenopodis]|uniref:Uncharacterized protein n=1 Tax=Protopolystoma xenopodis TaxID=117903 RepID=A0A3S5A6F3_9PLAT|nr:unnamed protein product [Protopolystoma xenopodis]